MYIAESMMNVNYGTIKINMCIVMAFCYYKVLKPKIYFCLKKKTDEELPILEVSESVSYKNITKFNNACK